MQSTIETKPPETYLPKQTNVQAAEAAADSINNIHPSVVTENLTNSETTTADEKEQLIMDLHEEAKVNEASQEDLPHDAEKQTINTHASNTPKEESNNPIISWYTKHEETIKPIVRNFSFLGIGLHGVAATSPFLNVLPQGLKSGVEKVATGYSRFISGLPMAVFSLPKFKAKNTIQALGNLVTAASFPLINTVENMPIASSLFCGINTAFEAIEKYEGDDKVTRKSDSLMHQIEEFTINYGKTWKNSAKQLSNNSLGITEKFRHVCNMRFVPGYALCQVAGMVFCRGRFTDSNTNPINETIARGVRTFRGILGTATDFFLLGSEHKEERAVGSAFVASSLLSIVGPWVDKLFGAYPKETQEKVLNIVGQTCKALDELGNVLWAGIDRDSEAKSTAS